MSANSNILKGAVLAVLLGAALTATADQDYRRSTNRGGISLGYNSRDFSIRLDLGNSRNRNDRYDRYDRYDRNDRYDRFDDCGRDYRGGIGRSSRYYQSWERRPVQSGLTSGRYLGPTRGGRRLF